MADGEKRRRDNVRTHHKLPRFQVRRALRFSNNMEFATHAPSEILALTASFLPLRDIVHSFSLVCKRWYQAANTYVCLMSVV